jgi:hypothetical protein
VVHGIEEERYNLEDLGNNLANTAAGFLPNLTAHHTFPYLMHAALFLKVLSSSLFTKIERNPLARWFRSRFKLLKDVFALHSGANLSFTVSQY